MQVNNIFQLDINVGIGDHIIVRCFLDQIKDRYSAIQITHSRPAMTVWRNNDMEYWKFIYALGDILYSEKPYQLVKQPVRFPFWPSERFIELGIKPCRPNIPGLIVNHSLTPKIDGEYIVLTTKIREMTKQMFSEFMEKARPIFNELSKKYKLVLLGEREVQKSKEYMVAINPEIIYSAYDEFKTLPNIVDLTIPALGIKSSDIRQVQHDCYLMSKAKAVLTLGCCGNVWLSFISAPLTLCLRADSYKLSDLFNGLFPELYFTRSVDELCNKLGTL